MRTVRRGTFETNSSSTHSFSIRRNSENWEELRNIFDSILYGSDNLCNSIYDCCDEEDLLDIIKRLHRAQEIILEGEIEW